MIARVTRTESPPAAPRVRRLSISLPAGLAEQLDQLADRRGFANRSSAVAEMIHQQMDAWRQTEGHALMAGTITLFYDESKPHLRRRLAEIQRHHIREVISSQHVLLEDNHVMEVMLVQGPASTLRHIADALMSCRGVRTGGLSLSAALLPPLHTPSRKTP